MNVAASRMKARYGKRDSDRNGENAGSDLCKICWVNQQSRTKNRISFARRTCIWLYIFGSNLEAIVACYVTKILQPALLHLLRPRSVTKSNVHICDVT